MAPPKFRIKLNKPLAFGIHPPCFQVDGLNAVIFSGGDKQLRIRDIRRHVFDGTPDCRKLYILYFVQLGCGEGCRYTKQTAKTQKLTQEGACTCSFLGLPKPAANAG